MVKMIAIDRLSYAGLNFAKGEALDASEQDAVVLEAIGKAKKAPAPVAVIDVPLAAAPVAIFPPRLWSPEDGTPMERPRRTRQKESV